MIENYLHQGLGTMEYITEITHEEEEKEKQ